MTTMRIAFSRKIRIRATAGAAATLLAVGLTPTLAHAATATAPTAQQCTNQLGSVATLPSVPYGDRFAAALTRGGRFAAECYAGAQEASMLFSEQATGITWRRVAADSGFGVTWITYDGPGTQQLILEVLLGDRPNSGWGAVLSARVINTDGPVSAYMNSLLAAFNSGNKDVAYQYARPGLVNRLWPIMPKYTWSLVNITAGAGQSIAEIESSYGHFGLIINAAMAANGGMQAVTGVVNAT